MPVEWDAVIRVLVLYGVDALIPCEIVTGTERGKHALDLGAYA